MSVTGVAGAVAAAAAVGATYTALRFNGNRVEGSRRLPVTNEGEQDGLVCNQQWCGLDIYSVFSASSFSPEVQNLPARCSWYAHMAHAAQRPLYLRVQYGSR